MISFFTLIGFMQWLPVYALPQAPVHQNHNPGTTGTVSPATASTSSASGLALDLTSTAGSIPVANVFSGKTSGVAIQQGGGAVMINGASPLLTPGQYVALTQVLAGVHQTIQLGSAGNVTGGTMSLNSPLLSGITSLVTPKSLSVVDDIARQPLTQLTGVFNNAGNFYALSSNPAIQTAAFSASSIINSGLLTSILPVNSNLPGISGATNNTLNLLLHTPGGFTNSGVVSTNGNLLIAANSISNSGTLSGSNIYLNSSGGTITNSGTIIATSGNLNIGQTIPTQMFSGGNAGIASLINNFNAIALTDISLNNLGGTLQAANAINFRDLDFRGSQNLSLNGGDLLSKALNLNAGAGVVQLYVNNIAGTVNVTAGCADIQANTDNLKIGEMNISGDPVVANTSGDVTITTDLTFPGQALAIVARGDILTGAGVQNIDTSNSNGNGGDILMVAGAEFTSTGGAHPTLTITGGTTGANSGGSINLGSGGSTPPIQKLSTTGGGTNASGGNLTMVAYGGSRTNAGTIFIPQMTDGVTTYGTGSGRSGNILIITGAQSGVGLTLNSQVNTKGNGTGTGGNVLIFSGSPSISGSSVIVTDGSVTSGLFGSGNQTNSYLATTSSGSGTGSSAGVTNTGSINIQAQGDIDISGTAGLNLGSITLVAGQTSTINLPLNITATTTTISGGSISINGSHAPPSISTNGVLSISGGLVMASISSSGITGTTIAPAITSSTPGGPQNSSASSPTQQNVLAGADGNRQPLPTFFQNLPTPVTSGLISTDTTNPMNFVPLKSTCPDLNENENDDDAQGASGNNKGGKKSDDNKTDGNDRDGNNQGDNDQGDNNSNKGSHSLTEPDYPTAMLRHINGVPRLSVSSPLQARRVSSVSSKQANHFEPVAYARMASASVPALMPAKPVALATPVGVNHWLSTQLKEVAPGRIRLTEGAGLYEAANATTIETPLGNVLLKRGALVFIDCREKNMTVLDMKDDWDSSVNVVVGEHSIKLAPGQRATLSAVESAVSPVQNIAQRRIKRDTAKNGTSIVVSDFSIIDAIGKCSHLRQFYLSSESRDKERIEQIIKTAAALSLTTAGGHGPYAIPASER